MFSCNCYTWRWWLVGLALKYSLHSTIFCRPLLSFAVTTVWPWGRTLPEPTRATYYIPTQVLLHTLSFLSLPLPPSPLTISSLPAHNGVYWLCYEIDHLLRAVTVDFQEYSCPSKIYSVLLFMAATPFSASPPSENSWGSVLTTLVSIPYCCLV